MEFSMMRKKKKISGGKSLLESLDHMHKKFEINQTKTKGSCQSGRKVVTHHSKSDLPLGNELKKTVELILWN